jgi:hypothetical protein
MRRAGVKSEAQGLPFVDVVVGDGRVVCSRGGVAGAVGDGSHGFDAEDAFEGEVGLVSGVLGSILSLSLVLGRWMVFFQGGRFLRERAGKVVCRDLVGGDQSFLDQVLGPGV